MNSMLQLNLSAACPPISASPLCPANLTSGGGLSAVDAGTAGGTLASLTEPLNLLILILSSAFCFLLGGMLYNIINITQNTCNLSGILIGILVGCCCKPRAPRAAALTPASSPLPPGGSPASTPLPLDAPSLKDMP